ncbi:hypothetical protein Mgra_00005661 [Meloidogyne graminicola]|uniref:Uncharacterized protein n=1 Tax=Meloidogyne graminicola TaxID=189291 RepID=A0A8S9ZP43_9BILA|nr:hypothetical protein Mgra_00005661 [Meloidogyne graminicola]
MVSEVLLTQTTKTTTFFSSLNTIEFLSLLFISALLFFILLPLGIFLHKILLQVYINRFEINMKKQFGEEDNFFQYNEEKIKINKNKFFIKNNKSIASLEEWI